MKTAKLLTVRETADALKLGTGLTRRLIRAGEIPSLRLGRAVRVSASSLERWIADREKGAAFKLRSSSIEKVQQGDLTGKTPKSVMSFASELFSVASLANFVGSSIGNAFELAISGKESFVHSLTKAVLPFFAPIAQRFGVMFVLIGSGLIWLGRPGGASLVGYGILLEALTGVLHGFANKIGQSKARASTCGPATTRSGTRPTL